MKKWFLAACLPLMIVSCDIFGLGDDGDDDDTMIVDPPMANVSFDYEDKILSGDTLVLTTYVRLVDPEVLFNNMPMEIEVIDNLPADNNVGSASDESAEVPPAVGGRYDILRNGRVCCVRYPRRGNLSGCNCFG